MVSYPDPPPHFDSRGKCVGGSWYETINIAQTMFLPLVSGSNAMHAHFQYTSCKMDFSSRKLGEKPPNFACRSVQIGK